MDNVFVLIEWNISDAVVLDGGTSEEQHPHVRGIAPTLDEAIKLAVVQKLMVDDWNSDDWQIEEVAFNTPIRPTRAVETHYAIPGAIAMYSEAGKFIRSPEKPDGPTFLVDIKKL
jgi:hypothetical protein